MITDVVRSTDGTHDVTNWGELVWKIGADAMPGAQTTFGTCRILPGARNPLHLHPNCEEVLLVLSGRCEHKLGDEVFELGPGDAIRIPQDVPHWARCIGDEPLFAAIFFSSGDRQAVNLDSDGAA